MPENIEIPYSKGHLYFSFLIFGIFYAVPIYGIYKDGFTFDLPTMLFFIIPTIMLVFFMRRFGMPTLKGESALELTPTGIIDRVRNRTIYWEDIESFDSGSTNTSSVVIIYIKDISKYKPSTYLGYIPYWLSDITFGSPVIIGTKFIDIEADKLITEMLAYWDKVFGPKSEPDNN
jgi:hypothetical protein